MHYGEVEKWGETLTNYFSSDFHHEFVKFCTNLSELLKNNGIIFWLKKIKKKWGKTQKSCWGCFLKSKLVSKETYRQNKGFIAIIIIINFNHYHRHHHQ